jgi:hypothetical protein
MAVMACTINEHRGSTPEGTCVVNSQGFNSTLSAIWRSVHTPIHEFMVIHAGQQWRTILQLILYKILALICEISWYLKIKCFIFWNQISAKYDRFYHRQYKHHQGMKYNMLQTLIIWQLYSIIPAHADHSGMNCLRLFEHWDRGFVSHSRNECLCAFIPCLYCPVCR